MKRKLFVVCMASLLVTCLSACSSKDTKESCIPPESIVGSMASDSTSLGDELNASADVIEIDELYATAEPEREAYDESDASEELDLEEPDEKKTSEVRIEITDDKLEVTSASGASEEIVVPSTEPVTAPESVSVPVEEPVPTPTPETPKETETMPVSTQTVPSSSASGCNHNYVEKMVQKESCGGCRQYADVCTLCGDEKNRHNDLSVPTPPHTRSASSQTGVMDQWTCTKIGQDYYVCDVCHGIVCTPHPAPGHDLTYEVSPGNCKEARWIYYTCKREGCSYSGHDEDYETDKNNHNWITDTFEEYDAEKGVVTYDMVICNRCNIPQTGEKHYH